ncbi:MAG: hypothetical protein U5P41_15415 [Gammaproteobacteria bacterium]|nr:hypothetical protein [Gammaproteobacteria bacterium]
MIIRLLPLLLAVLPAAHAADSTELDAREQQRLNGYGWALYNNLFDNNTYQYSPLSHSLDMQMELAAADRWREIEYGGGRNAVWQDPERGLVSAIASYLRYDTEQVYRFGAEGEWYHGSLTASGHAGYLEGSIKSQPFAGVDLRWYATDNLSLQFGGEQIDDITMGRIRMEYQPGFEKFQGLSFFARAAGGSEDHEYILGGFRYSFGESGSLLMRDRGNPNAVDADRLSPHFESLYFR